jgi:transposase
MDLALTEQERGELAAAAQAEQRTRAWKRYQAVLLVAEGQAPATVAHALRCSEASVYNWAARWRTAGLTGLAEGPHPGAAPRLDAAGAALLAEVLGSDPQARGHYATGWTVPLLRTELAPVGDLLSARTLRRTLHRLGYRWQRPQYVLGRPDPAYAEKRGPSSPRPKP